MRVKNVSLIYPNRFKGGISSLAMHILHNHLNSYKDIVCKMHFLENYKDIKNKDAIIITLQYENDYFNVVNIINHLKKNNPNGIFIGGGPCAIGNPLPLSDYFDAFVIGEIEGTDIMYNLINGNFDIKDGVYLPKDMGKINREEFKKIKRIYPKKLDTTDYPTYQYTHKDSAYGKAYLLEIGRGCPRRCKFCMARAIYYPPRFRKLDDLKYLVDEGFKYTDVDKVALISPSVGDYRHILDICQYILEKSEKLNKNIEISPSSIRPDTITEELLSLLNVKTLTLGIESGSEELRNHIMKDISNEDIYNAIDIGRRFNINKVKLYFMVGLPNESDEDINEIIKMIGNIRKNFKKVEVSVNPFIPKPFTDFEYERFDINGKNKIKYIVKSTKGFGNVSISYDNFNSSIIQCVLSRGAHELGPLLEYKPTQFLKYLKKNNLLNKYLEGENV